MKTRAYVFAAVQLPDASSLQRTSEVARQAEELIMSTPGVKYVTTIVGFSLLSQVTNTNSAFFFITLKDWAKRKKPEEQYIGRSRLSCRRSSEASAAPSLLPFHRRPSRG